MKSHMTSLYFFKLENYFNNNNNNNVNTIIINVKNLLITFIIHFNYSNLLYIYGFKFSYICKLKMDYTESNMPTPSSKFLREKCSARIDVFFVAKVRSR